ncbi:hypothetical protein, partial [Helicobacter sp. T3_23-1059]
EKFLAGFIAGGIASKALGNKIMQKHAVKQIQSIQNKYKALEKNNLPLFAKILRQISPQTFIKQAKEINALSNEIFNKELSQAIKNAINSNKIESLPQANFNNISDFRGVFDRIENNIGYISTPLGEVKVNTQYALQHFKNNTYHKDRTAIKGGFFETFRNPLFIVEDNTNGKGSIYFYKPFYDKEKNMLNLFGIAVNEKGITNFKTYYLDEKNTRLKQILKNGRVSIKYVAKE